MELKLNLESLEKESFKIDAIQFQKMIFLYNALDDGWNIKKINDSYIFSKKGISIIKEKDIYNVEERSDIIVWLEFV